MVMFDIKLPQKGESSDKNTLIYRLPTPQGHNTYNDSSYIPTFNPDIGHVITFGNRNSNNLQSNSGKYGHAPSSK